MKTKFFVQLTITLLVFSTLALSSLFAAVAPKSTGEYTEADAQESIRTFPDNNFPGDRKGHAQAGWIAPFVFASGVTIGQQEYTTITCYNEKGKIVRTITDPIIQNGAAFGPDRHTVYGLYGDWKLRLPERKFVKEKFSTAFMSSNGQMFIDRYPYSISQYLFDIYVNGKFVNTLGPYEDYENGFNDPIVMDDGSAGLLIWGNKEKKEAQVVVIGPDGKLRFQVNVEHSMMNPIPAPNGAGVLLEENGGKHQMIWYTAKGKQHSLDMMGVFEAWVPDSTKAIMATAGINARYLLLDWDTGKTIWDIPCPGTGNGEATNPISTPEYALFNVAEYSGTEGLLRTETFYAINLIDGSLAGSWKELYPERYLRNSMRGIFTYRDEELFFFNAEEFFSINFNDIRKLRNGWRLNSDDSKIEN